MKKIIVFTLFSIIMVTAFAQPHKSRNEERWEKYRSEKIAFLTTNLELTPDEAQRFWPVYNQLEKERWESQKQRREMEEKVLEAEETMPDPMIKELTREFAGSMKKEADMLASYNEKFLTILPPRKVLKLYKSENEFRMYMIKKWRDKKHKED
jgi:hypothetical protein